MWNQPSDDHKNYNQDQSQTIASVESPVIFSIYWQTEALRLRSYLNVSLLGKGRFLATFSQFEWTTSTFFVTHFDRRERQKYQDDILEAQVRAASIRNSTGNRSQGCTLQLVACLIYTCNHSNMSFIKSGFVHFNVASQFSVHEITIQVKKKMNITKYISHGPEVSGDCVLSFLIPKHET